MTWTDDFNRPDGLVDNGWTMVGGNTNISSGIPVAVGSASILRTFTGADGAQTVTLSLNQNAQPVNVGYPVLKAASDMSDYYSATCHSVGYNWWYSIDRVDDGVVTQLTTGGWDAIPNSTYTMVLSYSSGTITLTIDGNQKLQTSDSTYDANTYLGIKTPGSVVSILTYTDNGPTPPYLTIEPDQVWVANPVNFLQATIHEADWSDVTDPGTGLTADKGFVASSYLETDTVQSFSWAALAQTGTVTITDPHTGATGTFTCTLYPPQDSGGSYPISEEGAGILDRTGDSCPEGTILTTCTTVDYNGGPLLGEALDTILYQLGGYTDQTVPDIGSVSLPSLIYELFAKQGEAGYWTVPELIDLLGGSPTVYSHADLKTAIDNITGADNQDVLDALAAYFGANPPTIEQLGTMVSDIATLAGYTLGDVLDAIAAIPGVDLSAITTKLDLIQPSTSADLTTITNQLTTIDGNVDDVENSLAAVRTVANLTLQDVIDAINGLTVTAPPAPPVWPGAGNITLGTPVALDDGVHLTGAMDGVIIALTSPPAKTGRRDFGGVIYYYGLGELAFETDDGDLEMWQYIGFPAMIATPKSMQHAGGVRLRMPNGGSGTITPWTAS